jgi:hypothetical protein
VHRPAWSRAVAAAPVVLAGLALLLLVVRLRLALTPLLSETYYDEAVTGLMSLAILRGEPQVFYWGQPYLGAVDAYLAALAFRLTSPGTLALRLAVVATAVLWAWAGWSLARRAAGDGAGFFAGLYLALPPIFLSYVQLSSHGETVAMSLAAAALALGACLGDPAGPAPDRRRLPSWAALGILAGLAWWGSQMTAMVLVAAALAATARAGVLRGPGPWLALAGFLVGGAPLWVWNARHEWSTFRHLAAWGAPLPAWSDRLRRVMGAFADSAQATFWDGRVVPLPPLVEALGPALLVAAYVPATLLAAGRFGIWTARLVRGRRPLAGALDAVALAFWLTAAAHLVTWFGTSGVIRYSMTFYVTVPVLTAVALARLSVAGRAARGVAATVSVALIAYHLMVTITFVRHAAGEPWRPVDAVLARLEALGLSACYADSQVAQVVSFESEGRVTCADFHGLRDYASLQAVDAVSDPSRVALVTHRRLGRPAPGDVAAGLTALGVESRREEIGDHVVFHGFRPPGGPVRLIDRAGWSATASVGAPAAALAFDRRVWTRWAGPQTPGTWFTLDLGQPRIVAQVTLEGGLPVLDAPRGLVLRTSTDGVRWDEVVRLPEVVPGLHWWRGRPRIDESARVILRLAPRPVRFLRFVHAGEAPGRAWGLAELFVYEPGLGEPPSPVAAEALAEADRLLARWRDDPTGPHPKRAPVTYEHRRAQVDWGGVSGALDRALRAAPEWEEVHHLHAAVMDLARWTEDPDLVVSRARQDGAWSEVERWTALAEAAHPGLWRAGRDTARVEALRALGHRSDADGLARRPPPAPGRRLDVEFGPGLGLVGVDLPARACPGEPLTFAGHWVSRGRLAGDHAAFVHLVGPGRRRLNLDHHLGEGYPTSRWDPGERVRQAVSLTLPPGTPPGRYRVRVGVWLPASGRRLRVTRTDQPREGRSVEVAVLEVADPSDVGCRGVPAP